MAFIGPARGLMMTASATAGRTDVQRSARRFEFDPDVPNERLRTHFCRMFTRKLAARTPLYDMYWCVYSLLVPHPRTRLLTEHTSIPHTPTHVWYLRVRMLLDRPARPDCIEFSFCFQTVFWKPIPTKLQTDDWVGNKSPSL